MKGTFNEDPAAFHAAWRDTVLGPKLAGLTREQALLTLGACVKSLERQSAHGWPKHHGILVSYDQDADRVVVRTHDDDVIEPRRVWTGTVAEYHECWEVD